MPGVPDLSTKPEYASTSSSGFIRVPFPGEGAAGWQVAALMAGLTVLLGIAPGMAGLVTVAAPGLYQLVRQQAAPKLELHASHVAVTVSGRTLSLSREALHSAGVVREGQSWALALQTEQGPLLLERTGASPSELQWAADLLEAWKTGARRAPAPRSAVIDEGLGASTFVVTRSWSRGEITVMSLGLLLMLSLWGALGWGLDLGSAISGFLLAPIAAALGYYFGERRTARVEIQVREQALLVRTYGGREQQQTLALEDVLSVEKGKDEVVLVLRDRRVRLPARQCADALASAIESHRERLAQQPAPPDDGRARLAELSRLRERAG